MAEKQTTIVAVLEVRFGLPVLLFPCIECKDRCPIQFKGRGGRARSHRDAGILLRPELYSPSAAVSTASRARFRSEPCVQGYRHANPFYELARRRLLLHADCSHWSMAGHAKSFDKLIREGSEDYPRVFPMRETLV